MSNAENQKHLWHFPPLEDIFHIPIFLKMESTLPLGFPLLTEFVSKSYRNTPALQGTSQGSTQHRPFQTSVTDLILAYIVKDKE